MRLSVRFLAAVLSAVAVVVQDYRNPEAWTAAVGIIIAAASSGATAAPRPLADLERRVEAKRDDRRGTF